MARISRRKNYRFSMRLPNADIATIDRAARLRSQSRTGFIRDAAVQAAEEVIVEYTVIRMSPAGFGAFVELLTCPAKPVPQMIDLLKHPAPRELKASSE